MRHQILDYSNLKVRAESEIAEFPKNGGRLFLYFPSKNAERPLSRKPWLKKILFAEIAGNSGRPKARIFTSILKNQRVAPTTFSTNSAKLKNSNLGKTPCKIGKNGLSVALTFDRGQFA